MATYPERGLQRILIGSASAVARTTLLDQDGEPAATVGTLTANLERADGTVLATGRATAAGQGLGAYTVTLTSAETALLDVIKITWIDGVTTRATSHHRIVGGFLFSTTDLAQRDGLSSVPIAAMRAARDTVTDLFETETGVAWSPTYDLDTYSHLGGRLIVNRRPLRAVRTVTANGAALDISSIEVDAAGGLVHTRIGGSGYLTVVGYEHGYSAPPADLRDEAINAARDGLLRQRSGLGDRARSLQNEMGTVSFSFAGPGHPTGIDSVDAALRRHDHRAMLA